MNGSLSWAQTDTGEASESEVSNTSAPASGPGVDDAEPEAAGATALDGDTNAPTDARSTSALSTPESKPVESEGAPTADDVGVALDESASADEESFLGSGHLSGGVAVGFRLTSLAGQEELPAVGLFLESHYVFPLNKNKTVGVGPFVAIQPHDRRVIASGALGVLLALRYSQKSNIGFALGMGALVTTKTETVGMEIESSPVLSPILLVSFRFF